MSEQFPPVVIPFSATANDSEVAPVGQLFYFPEKVKVTAIGVTLAEPLVTADVKLSGNLWAFNRSIDDFLSGGHRKFLDEIGPSDTLRSAPNKVIFGDSQDNSDLMISMFPIDGDTVGNIFVMDVALGKYATMTQVRGQFSVRFEAVNQ